MDIAKLKAAAEIAKTKTNDPRWHRAIANAIVECQKWIITECERFTLITNRKTEMTYRVNGTCGCRAFQQGIPCKHRAYVRLDAIARETPVPEIKSLAETDPLAFVWSLNLTCSTMQNLPIPREQACELVKILWKAKYPHNPLYLFLIRRFGVNHVDLLNPGALAGNLGALVS